MHRYDGFKDLIATAFFEGNMAAFLAQLNESGAFQDPDYSSPETLGSLGISMGNFDRGPE